LSNAELSLSQVHERVAAEVPDRECIVHGDRRLTYAEVTRRTRSLAGYLRERGLGCHRERKELEGWESGQDHVGLYMYNCSEYLESMLAAFKARAVPFNVNYRYVREELLYLFRDAGIRALVYQSGFASQVAELLPELPGLELLIQVPDDSGAALLPGAILYEDAIAAGSPELSGIEWSPDDLYMLYTGGTTGMPKGVLWRQADILNAAMGGRRPDGGENTLEDYTRRAARNARRVIPSPPFMHGSAQWSSFNQFHAGNTVIIQGQTKRLDPDDIWSTAERERATSLCIVGDAFARPLLQQLERKTYDLSEIQMIITGAAVTSASAKRGLLEKLPGIRIVDVMGASETGPQGEAIDASASEVGQASFALQPGARVLSEDLSRIVPPDSDEIGWLAQSGRVPLGYLGDREKTQRTFPVVEGVRYSVPGDRARWSAAGAVELLGRESVTINSGGEKIFAEEVEMALKQHPAVYDAIVCGRPSERWGQEVVAVVRLVPGRAASDAELLEECARHVARFKLPKALIHRDEVRRSPSGKPDYAWAREQAVAEPVQEA
jgi:fatty-acyl-CoA synthase